MMPKRAAPSGFTLVELLVGVALSSILMAAVLSSYLYLARNLTRLAYQQSLETEGRNALGYFTLDAQAASAVTITPVAAPDFSITFVFPRLPSGATQATYYYSRAGTSTSIAGNTVVVPAGTIVRVLSTGSALVGSVQVLLRDTIGGDNACTVRFFDSSGHPFDNGTPPYTPVTAHGSGIKQASFQFSTQRGDASSGTLTRVLQFSSSRILLRNRGGSP